MKTEKMLHEIISGYGIDTKSSKSETENKTKPMINAKDIVNLIVNNLIEMFEIASKDQTNDKEISKIILEISDISKNWVKKLSKNTSPELKAELKKNKAVLKEQLEQLLLNDTLFNNEK